MTAWHDLGFVGGRDKPSSADKHLAYVGCEGSSMRREARRVEPGQALGNGEGFARLSLGERLVAERGERYGHPIDNYRRIGIVWQAILDLPEPVPPPLVGLMLKGVKLARLVNAPFDEDGLDDMDGYSEAQRELGKVWNA